jgi:hypothetical protein
MDEKVLEKPVMLEKPVALSNMRTYSMDAKGVFILSD